MSELNIFVIRNMKRAVEFSAKRFFVWLAVFTLLSVFVNAWVKFAVWAIGMAALYAFVWRPTVNRFDIWETIRKANATAAAQKAELEAGDSYIKSKRYEYEWEVAHAAAIPSQEVQAQRIAMTADIAACMDSSGYMWEWPKADVISIVKLERISDSFRCYADIKLVPGVYPPRVESVVVYNEKENTTHLYPNLPFIQEQKEILARNKLVRSIDELILESGISDANWWWLDAAAKKICIKSEKKGWNWCEAVVTAKDDAHVTSIKVFRADGKTNIIRAKKADSTSAPKNSTKKTAASEPSKAAYVAPKATHKEEVESPFLDDEKGLDTSSVVLPTAAAPAPSPSNEEVAIKNYRGKVAEKELAELIELECSIAVNNHCYDMDEPCRYVFPAADDKTWSDFAVRDNEAELFAQVVVDDVPDIYGYEYIDREKRKIVFLVNVGECAEY